MGKINFENTNDTTYRNAFFHNKIPLDSFMSCLHSLLGYSIGEFQALQLIVLVAFGAVD